MRHFDLQLWQYFVAFACGELGDFTNSTVCNVPSAAEWDLGFYSWFRINYCKTSTIIAEFAYFCNRIFERPKNLHNGTSDSGFSSFWNLFSAGYLARTSDFTMWYNKEMEIQSTQEMTELGRKLGEKMATPAAIELIGDVGVGKTTFTQGLAEGLGIDEEINSPSFTISKRYALPKGGELVHYDFYRLNDAGIMRDELAETLAGENNVVIVEWAGGVADLLGDRVVKINISLQEDSSRLVEISDPNHFLMNNGR